MTEDPNSPALRAGVDFRGTRNATEKVQVHVPPGRTRAPLLRYIKINLPRTTRLVLLGVVALIGASSAAVALSDHEPFPLADLVLWAVLGASVVFVAVGLVTQWRIWTWGVGIALTALLVYLGGLAGNPPYVWNGASIPLAATWNATMFASLVYLVLYWALNYGMIVASPDDQGFLD